MKEPEALGMVLARQVEAYGWHRARWGSVIHACWQEAVGPVLARHTRVVGLRERGVVVAVPASAWAQELTYWKAAILARLNHQLANRGQPIEELVVRVMPLRRLRAVAGEIGLERGGVFRARPNRRRSLDEAFAAARSRFEEAVQFWLAEGYHRCQRCQSPTLLAYPMCSTCEHLRRLV
ncbi:MAG: DUF721 domain-containing protein [Firmicutes bacterium]|nr:DUF721 domain-containing protein [Bacillota bacterium]